MDYLAIHFKVVVCPGPWASKLFPELAPHLKTPVIPVTYWRDKTVAREYSVAEGFPVIFNARLTDVYGVPSYEYQGKKAYETAKFCMTLDYSLYRRSCQDCLSRWSRGKVNLNKDLN